jgi:hypothetical protein
MLLHSGNVFVWRCFKDSGLANLANITKHNRPLSRATSNLSESQIVNCYSFDRWYIVIMTNA